MKPPPLFGVHGWLFEPSIPEQNAMYSLYPAWTRMMEREIVPFVWDSNPSFWDMMKACWNRRKKYQNTYQVSYDDAAEAGKKLASVFPPGADIIAHSLGTRVALQAIKHGAEPRKVLLLGGSEYCHVAEEIVRENPGIRFYNALSRKDFILEEFGYKYGPFMWKQLIGRHGLWGLSDWSNHSVGNTHWDYYADPQYWPLWRELMA